MLIKYYYRDVFHAILDYENDTGDIETYSWISYIQLNELSEMYLSKEDLQLLGNYL